MSRRTARRTTSTSLKIPNRLKTLAVFGLALLPIMPMLPAQADDAVFETALRPLPGEEASGGSTTVFDRGHGAFGRALENLDPSRWPAMRAGKRLVDSPWGQGPRQGLGPRFNTVSCSGCHFRDGRGAPPKAMMAPPEPAPLIARLRSTDGKPDPVYGAQLNDHGVGVPGEGRLDARWTEILWRSEDGEEFYLRRPEARVHDLTLGPTADETRVDLRVPPTLVGLGLLEAVPVETLEASADPDDLDGDGVSGRLRRVRNNEVGRFGWTAAQPNLRDQVAAAFLEDIGITSELQPVANCSPDDEACRRSAGADVELSEYQLDRVALYTRLLAPPARRDWTDPQVLEGRELFAQIGCASCHIPSLRTVTAAQAEERGILPELADQTIRPFTDLLLHDLGPDLADGGREDGVEPGEWRTAPLWGLGLQERVNGHLSLLHDGRARTFEEAVLWHGGEASSSRRAYVDLSLEERESLLRFLQSL